MHQQTASDPWIMRLVKAIISGLTIGSVCTKFCERDSRLGKIVIARLTLIEKL